MSVLFNSTPQEMYENIKTTIVNIYSDIVEKKPSTSQEYSEILFEENRMIYLGLILIIFGILVSVVQ
jgi:hypothetical protein